MDLYFVFVKDLLNTKEFVYNNSPCSRSDVAAMCRSFFNQVKESNGMFGWSLSEHENHFEIFQQQQITKVGWIWNSVSSLKQAAYLLTIVPLHEQHTDYQAAHTSVQTESEPHHPESCVQSSQSIRQQLYDTCETVPHGCNQDSNELDFGNISMNLGYANNTLDRRFCFTQELKQKLTTPNFGLRNRSHNRLATASDEMSD